MRMAARSSDAEACGAGFIAVNLPPTLAPSLTSVPLSSGAAVILAIVCSGGHGVVGVALDMCLDMCSGGSDDREEDT